MLKLAAVFIFIVTTVCYSAPLTALAQDATAPRFEQYTKDKSPYRLKAAQAKKIIEGRARDVLQAIKNKDARRLSSMVHPTRGLRFSAYAWVDRDDKWLSRQQVRNLFSNNRKSVWLTADEAGTKMRMTAREYFDKILYDNDYLKAREITYNTQYKRSNTIPNVLDFYPRAIVVEYYDEPNPDPSERGWDTLWLVFEKSGREWYLVGIVKDTPTI